MIKKKEFILSIAGFDPCSGAGITSDIKTIEAHKGYALGVITANTLQTENNFLKCIWIDKNVILEQINLLFNTYKINFVKIGIIENWHILLEIINLILEKNKNVKILWDPILKSETGYCFNEKNNKILDEILSKIFIFVPNYLELKTISKDNTDDFLREKSKITNIFLKGGHRTDNKRYYDYLYSKEGSIYHFKPKKISKYLKHGSGCVISSSICTNLAVGFSLIQSCLKAKRYTENFLNSNKTLLGFHKYRN